MGPVVPDKLNHRWRSREEVLELERILEAAKIQPKVKKLTKRQVELRGAF